MPSAVDRKASTNAVYNFRYAYRRSYAYGDESDLDQNINRLCQYLSGSEEEEENEEEAVEKRPQLDHFIRNVGQKENVKLTLREYSKSKRQPRRNSSYYGGNFKNHFTNSSSEKPGKLKQAQIRLLDMHSRKLFSPQDILQIPPPPSVPHNVIAYPLPPQRPLPPLPDDSYEEARSLQETGSTSNSASSTVSIARNKPNSIPTYFAVRVTNDGKTEGSVRSPRFAVVQRNCENGFSLHQNEPAALEHSDSANIFTGTSESTTTSPVSPSRRSELEQLKNSYLLLPVAQQQCQTANIATLPCSAGSVCFQGMKSLRKQQKLSEYCCSWKFLTYLLTSALIFSLAVICYLLVMVTREPTDIYQNVHYVSSADSVSPDLDSYSPNNFGHVALRPFPESFSLNDVILADLPPGVMTTGRFILQRDSYVQFNLTVEPRAKLAVYLRQTLQPSITEYDKLQIVLGSKLHLKPTKRSHHFYEPFFYQASSHLKINFRSVSFTHSLSSGRWFIAFFNDDTDIRIVNFSVSITSSSKQECKYGCFDKGICNDGLCACFDGYAGEFCEKTICPAICNGNGLFSGGRCHCHQGWKGVECDVPYSICEIPNCNNHGQCGNDGQCICDPGYKGEFCEELDCPSADCNGQGVCVKGLCYCRAGWTGSSCEISTSLNLCSSYNQCSEHGQYDDIAGVCLCDDGWVGPKCDVELCLTDCGAHGKCINQICQCDAGWTGVFCNELACLPGCEEHGICKNGSCACFTGWAGQNCQIENCQNNCSNHGICQRDKSGKWGCICEADFDGPDCRIPLETNCSDGIDNDNDGLTDCEELECCLSSSRCSNDSMCQTVANPLAILASKQSSPRHASFFQKVRFIAEKNSVQLYADTNLFNKSRVSVMRGRVVNQYGSPLIGVRITDTSNMLYGFTLSRKDGSFDLLVNGGGSVTLQLTRLPFGSSYKTFPIHWNTVTYVGDITLSKNNNIQLSSENDQTVMSYECVNAHRSHNLKPFILPSWKINPHGIPGSALPIEHRIVADIGAVEESVRLPSTDVRLVYLSSTTAGYKSLLYLQLLPSILPDNIRLVKLMIDVEGTHLEEILSPTRNLTYTFQWDALNVYKQKVYGLTYASVSIGYVYSNCDVPVWWNERVKLSGIRTSSSDIGGWNLNIHHYLDISNGVLEKGDGSVIYLKEEDPVLTTVLGNGDKRSLDCPFCEVPPNESTFYFPMALAVGKDGTLFIGDHTLIRCWSENGSVQTLLELSHSDIAHLYHLAVHPRSGDIYISLPSRRQIIRVLPVTSHIESTLNNFVVAVGSGEACVADEGESCGDGGPAEIAKLTFPKGITFDSKGNLYIADDRKIRMVTVDGLIKTILGSDRQEDLYLRDYFPENCSEMYDSDEFHLIWPTEITFDNVQDRLIFVDSDVVYEYKTDEKIVRLMQGIPAQCLSSKKGDSLRRSVLHGVTSVAVSQSGMLAVAETDKKILHRVQLFDSHGRLHQTIGGEMRCHCNRKNCPCNSEDVVPVAQARLHRPVAVAYNEADTLFIVDQGNLKIRSVQPAISQLKPVNDIYQISFSDSHEIYGFNQFGQHIYTKDMNTNLFKYNFSYHIDTSYGKLISFTLSDGQRIFIRRKKPNRMLIELPEVFEVTVELNPINRWTEKITGTRLINELRYEYIGDTGLIKRKSDDLGQQWHFDYDSNGRIRSFKTPSGSIINMRPSIFVT
ncbi:Teneurin-m [Trichinella zimbabwensis]|uniref:Teneurin-m n=1 Tax=Trichinella zimbabwensis TaxID=268475 RepID=A0A0V1HV37_9BILA|nr:Teneurin-m [Trichinella zimbabwensis]